ncbi:MAG: TonB protein C-terminal [Mucilaginibacter sp.]|nr:TonB protein C-terminal [Mucilaginibacter sp.]
MLIRKYLNGELDARAMHQLEKRAQDDPFLMDAIEGYEKAGSDQQPHLDELGGRLQQRVIRKERRIIPMKFIAIAASILVVLTIGALWLYKTQPQKTKTAQVATTEIKAKPVLPPQTDITKPDTTKTVEIATLRSKPRLIHAKKSATANKQVMAVPGPVIVADEIASLNSKSKDKQLKDTVPLNEVIVMGYTTQRKKDVAASMTTVSPGVERLLQGRAAGVMIRGTGANNINVPKKTIKGKIIGKYDGLPIVGATVRVQGTNASTITDANGMFNLSADSTKSKLIVAYIGYTARQVNIRQRDSLNTIALEPANATLAEVVVTGYTNTAATDNATVTNAHPQAGWSGFKKYLKENAVSPDGKAGVVKLSFQVDRAGAVSDIAVVKGLSPATDQKAIELIKNGPPWTGSSTGKPEKVKVRLKFVK